MNKLNLTDVTQYVEENIGSFHAIRFKRLQELSLQDIVTRKNPYLFKAKNMLTASEIVKAVTDAFISSGEETTFGNWLENLAIFINMRVYEGRKSAAAGIDLEFDHDNIRYIVAIKSGPNWGNHSQIEKMKTDFDSAAKTLRTSNSKINIRAVNGCCYGFDNKPDKGRYLKLCGQNFWEFISGETDLYLKLIVPLSHQAKERNDEFMEAYSQKINLFNKEFLDRFCTKEGAIDWDKWLKVNSGAQK